MAQKDKEKGFLKKMIDKFDKKLEEKSKKCCCCQGDSKCNTEEEKEE